MPEGPSIVIARDTLKSFVGKEVILAMGNSKKIEFAAISGNKIVAVKSWGKHLLICFETFTIRVHFMMFGSYRINEFKEDATPRLSMQFKGKESINLYTCSILPLYQPIDEIYDWSSDVMNSSWSPKNAIKKVVQHPNRLITDILLDQTIFAGVGNIIKNEVLYRTKIHPSSKIGKIPKSKLNALIKQAVTYSFEFLEWKLEFSLKKHWKIYTKKNCPKGHVVFKEYLGLTNRRTFFCKTCQKLYK